MIRKVVIIGPAHPLRGGGISSFNQRLCEEFSRQGFDCQIFSFSLQYPSFLFPGKSQYSTDPAPPGLKIYSVINSVNPFNWWHIGNTLRRMKPDLVVVRYWIPFMGPCLGTVLRRIRKNGHTRIIAITDNVIPHEKRPGDRWFTRYFLKPCQGFVTLGEQVMKDLQSFGIRQPAIRVAHPLYDNFGEAVPKAEARKVLGIPDGIPLILFFGFIRKYKGLDLLLEAMHILRQEGWPAGSKPPQLLIAGEFYEDEKKYREQISNTGLSDQVIVRNQFIPDIEIKYYLCAADCVVQPYRHATQSGVTPLAYHFEIPMIVTNVGSLPEQVPHEKAGLVCEPAPASIAHAIRRYFELGEDHFLPELRSEKKKYSWAVLVNSLTRMAAEIPTA